MLKHEFEKLSLEEKGEEVFNKGKFIGTRDYYKQKMVLYDLNGLFVEVGFNNEKNAVVSIEPIKNEKVLDRYIDANT